VSSDERWRTLSGLVPPKPVSVGVLKVSPFWKGETFLARRKNHYSSTIKFYPDNCKLFKVLSGIANAAQLGVKPFRPSAKTIILPQLSFTGQLQIVF